MMTPEVTFEEKQQYLEDTPKHEKIPKMMIEKLEDKSSNMASIMTKS